MNPACTGKEAFASIALANKAAARKGRGVYKCPECHNWHVSGHPMQDVDRRRELRERDERYIERAEHAL